MSLWNWNTKLSIMLGVVSSIASSIWVETVLSSFLYGLAREMGKKDQENTLVGLGEGVWGISQLIFALPVGYLADKYWGTSKTIRLGSLVTLFTIGLNWWSVLKGSNSQNNPEDATSSYIGLMFSQVAWGIVSGITNGPAQALFADSVPENLLTDAYTYVYASCLIASSVGSLITIYMFNRLSDQYDDWDLKEIKQVFLLGLSLEILVAIIMMLFKDTQEEKQIVVDKQETINNNRTIPVLLFISSLITACGSGMSSKFYPLFFKESGLSPANVQWIFVALPLCIALSTLIAKYLGKLLGRIQATLLLETCGSLLLFLLSALDSQFKITTPWVSVPIFLLMISLMNCSYPLVESVLMSSVPSSERSRWKSLGSIASFNFTASGVFGGMLSDSRGYSFLFAITAMIQLVGLWMLYPLIYLVPKETSTNNADLTQQERADSADLN